MWVFQELSLPTKPATPLTRHCEVDTAVSQLESINSLVTATSSIAAYDALGCLRKHSVWLKLHCSASAGCDY
jgi:hypothetical protein